jgi:hypothetical protein
MNLIQIGPEYVNLDYLIRATRLPDPAGDLRLVLEEGHVIDVPGALAGPVIECLAHLLAIAPCGPTAANLAVHEPGPPAGAWSEPPRPPPSPG